MRKIFYVIIILVGLLLIGSWAFNMVSINSFEACVFAGNSVMGVYDEDGGWKQHCYTPDGKKFIEDCMRPFNSCV